MYFQLKISSQEAWYCTNVFSAERPRNLIRTSSIYTFCKLNNKQVLLLLILISVVINEYQSNCQRIIVNNNCGRLAWCPCTMKRQWQKLGEIQNYYYRWLNIYIYFLEPNVHHILTRGRINQKKQHQSSIR